MDTGDGSLTYLTDRPSPLKLTEVVGILKTPDDSRAIRQSPPTPRGGEVYLYKIQDFEEGVWRKDSYHFRCDGKQKQPKNNPVIIKEFHKAYKENKSTTKRFVKEAYYLYENEPEYVLVQYRGNQKLALPHPKARKRSLIRIRPQFNAKSRNTEVALLGYQPSTPRATYNDSQAEQSSILLTRKDRDLTAIAPHPMPVASSLDSIVFEDPLESATTLSPEQHVALGTTQYEFAVTMDTYVQNNSNGIDICLQTSGKRKLENITTLVKPDSDDVVCLGRENLPVKHPKIHDQGDCKTLCEITEGDVAPFQHLRDFTEYILKKRHLVLTIQKILSQSQFWSKTVTFHVTNNPCMSLIDEVNRHWSQDVINVTHRLQWTNLCTDVLRSEDDKSTYLKLIASVIVGAYYTGTGVPDFVKTLDERPEHLTQVQTDIRCSRDRQYTVGRYTVRGLDLLRVQGNTWLNDDVIDTYLHLLEGEWCSRISYHCLVLSTQTFLLWEKGRYSLGTTNRQTDLSNYTWILMPVNLPRNQHWVLLVTNIPDRTVGVVNSKPDIEVEDVIIEHWRNFIQQSISYTNDVWTTKQYKMIEQTDGHSCGVFALMAAEALLAEETPTTMRNFHSNLYRQYTQRRILQCAHSKNIVECHKEIRNGDLEDTRDGHFVCKEGVNKLSHQFGSRSQDICPSVESDGSWKTQKYASCSNNMNTSTVVKESTDIGEDIRDGSVCQGQMNEKDNLDISGNDGEQITGDKATCFNNIKQPEGTLVECSIQSCFQVHLTDKYKLACLLLIALAGGHMKEQILDGKRGRSIHNNKHLKWALQACDIPNEANINEYLKACLLHMQQCCILYEKKCFTYKSSSISECLHEVMQEKNADLIAKMDIEFIYKYMKPKMKDNTAAVRKVFQLEVGEDMQNVLLTRFLTLLEEGKFAFLCSHPFCSIQSFVDKLWNKLSQRAGNMKTLKKLLTKSDVEYGQNFLFWSSIADNSLLLKTATKNISFSKQDKSEALFGCCLSSTPSNFDFLISSCDRPRHCVISQACFQALSLLSALSTYFEPSENENKYSLIEIACLNGCDSIVEKLLKMKKWKLPRKKNCNTCLHYACFGKTDNHVRIAKMLLDQQQFVINSIGLYGQSPLHCACFGGNMGTVNLLLRYESGVTDKEEKDSTRVNNTTSEEHRRGDTAIVHQKSKYGNIPSHKTSHKGNRSVVKLLVCIKHNIDEKNSYGDTPLHNAAKMGHREVVELLLQKRAKTEVKNNNGDTPLHMAAWQGHKDVAEILLQNKSRFDEKNNNGDTPLHMAAWQGNKKVVELLLQKNAKIEEKNNSGDTPLHKAAYKAHKGVVALLLQNKANIDEENNNGETPLHKAVRQGHRKVVEFLLRIKVHVDGNSKDTHGETPLHMAAYWGHRDVTEFLLKAMINVDEKDNNGETHLHTAAYWGHREVAELLLQNKANVDEENNNGETPLHKAVRQGHRKVVEFLLRIKVHVDGNSKDTHGETPLHMAAYWGHRYVTEFLLKAMINVDEKDNNGETPLHTAAYWGHREVAELLLQNKANVDEENNNGETPLHTAAYWGHREVAELLLQNKANVDEENNNGETPLHKAACQGYREVTELLLHNKANVDGKNNHGDTPLHVAVEQGHREVAELLLQTKAHVDGKDTNGETPLHMAAYWGHRDVAELLLQTKTNVDEKNNNGETPLHTAAYWGHWGVVEFFLQNKAKVDEKDNKGETSLHKIGYLGYRNVAELLLQNKATVDEKNNDGCTLLHKAAYWGHWDVVEFLLQNMANVDEKDIYGGTPLHKAAWQGHRDVVVLLLHNKANVNGKDNKGETPLHKAAFHGHMEVASLLLQTKANVDEKDKKGETPLHKAAWQRHKEIAELLLKNRANINHKANNGEIPLHKAVWQGHREVVVLLLQTKANVNEKEKNAETPLHKAAWQGHREVAEFLLQYKANADVKDNKGETPLHKAAWQGHGQVVKMISQNKRTIDGKDNIGETPLHKAAWQGHMKVVEWLLKNMANADVKDNKCETPLHKAAWQGHREAVVLLLQNKAKVDEEDNTGETPLHKAEYQGHREVVELLLQNEASVNEKDEYGVKPLHNPAWQ